MTRDLATVLLCLAVFFIALNYFGSKIDGLLDRASESIAERDSDWRSSLPPAWQTPATKHLGKTRVGIDDREAV